MPSLADTVVAGDSESRVQYRSGDYRQQKVLAADVSFVFRCRQHGGQYRAIAVNARGVVHIVEFKGVRRGAVGERRSGGRKASFAEESRRGPVLLPAREASIEGQYSGRVAGA